MNSNTHKIIYEVLPKKEISWSPYYAERPDKIKAIERVLYYDPSALYDRISHKINPFKRHQGLQMDDLFPHTHSDVCACGGCGEMPKQFSEGKFHKWAHQSCSQFAGHILSIINNYFGVPATYINHYAGHVCCQCSETNGLELDHIVGVKHGGGGSWLSNYRWLCSAHHRNKTNESFGFKEHKNKTQLKIDIDINNNHQH